MSVLGQPLQAPAGKVKNGLFLGRNGFAARGPPRLASWVTLPLRGPHSATLRMIARPDDRVARLAWPDTKGCP
jgi:hypothetical protein